MNIEEMHEIQSSLPEQSSPKKRTAKNAQRHNLEQDDNQDILICARVGHRQLPSFATAMKTLSQREKYMMKKRKR